MEFGSLRIEWDCKSTRANKNEMEIFHINFQTIRLDENTNDKKQKQINVKRMRKYCKINKIHCNSPAKM